MKKKLHVLKRILVVAMAVVISASFFVGCKKEEVNMESTEYNAMAGVDLNSPIAKLVVNNQSSYKIVIPEEASECEEYSASELQDFVKQATGVNLQIVSDKKVKLGDRCISLGNTKLYQESGMDTSSLNVDGFKMKTEGESVIIKGERDAGTLFGVYDFLEKFLGIKFLTSDYTYVPSLDSVQLYEMDVEEIPSFETRFAHNNDARYKQAEVVRMRLSPNNAGSKQAKAKFGGVGLDHAGQYHSYDYHCPTSVHRAEHPEWFSDPNGDGAVQPALANGLTDDGEVDETMEESVVKTFIESVKKLLLENPTARYVPLGQNDSDNWSMQEDDVRQRELFGGTSGHIVVFVNAIAKAVDEWLEEEGMDRDIQYWLFAYGNSFDAPDQTAPKANLAVPRDNVYVMLAPLQDAWNVPLNDPRNGRTYKMIPNWQAITDNFYMYDYTGNFNNVFNWSPTLTVLKPNALYYKEIGVTHYTSEGGCFGYVNKVKLYVLSKLMWNVDRDVNELISEYNRYCFGEEAGKVLDEMIAFCDAHYYEIAFCGDAFKKAGLYDVGSTWQKSVDTLNVNFVRRVESYVSQAKSIIEADETLSQKQLSEHLLRLNDAELMVDMMKYLNYDQLWKTTEAEKQKFLQEFYNRVKKTPVEKFGSKWTTSVVEEFAKHGIY